MTSRVFGAGSVVWAEYRRKGWSDLMLPVVSNPNIKKAASSAIKELGKVPTVKNAAGEAVGIRGWTNIVPADAQLDEWAADDDLGICIRCGTVVAFDCDCSSTAVSDAIKRTMLDCLFVKSVPLRARADAPARWLTAFRITEPVAKQRLVFDGENMLEVLGRGNQFAAEGTHPKGARYEWTERPTLADLPEITPAQLDDILTAIAEDVEAATGLKAEHKASRSAERGAVGATIKADDPLADWLRENGYVLSEDGDKLNLRCPWEDEHSETTEGGTATSYFFAGSGGRMQPGFSCLHAHCAHRNYTDLLAFAHAHGFDEHIEEALPTIEPTAEEKPKHAPRYSEKELAEARADMRSELNEKSGKIKATITTVCGALVVDGTAEFSADSFTHRTVVRRIKADGSAGEWHPLTDGDVLEFWADIEKKRGFSPIGKDLMRAAIERTANRRPIDTMVEYLGKTLPEWDGVPRVERFFADYCGADDDEFSAALGRYLFAALYGRAATTTGVKADITPIIIGRQGARKSTLVEVLAMRPEWSVPLTLDSKPEDTIRKMTGRVTAELPELAGMSRKDVNDVKMFLSQHTDSMVDKWDKYASTFPRRCVFIMTTNEQDILQDPTGSRRFAPIMVGDIKIEDVKRDLLQLWAEGREIFKAEGIQHGTVEKLAAARADSFALVDAWAEDVAAFLDANESSAEPKPLTSTTILQYGVGVPTQRVTPKEARRIAGIMRSLGYVRKNVRIKDGPSSGVTKAWTKA